jgi:peptidoglycan/xylan/chitin deacetylase (PgdA/CDA1 family)
MRAISRRLSAVLLSLTMALVSAGAAPDAAIAPASPADRVQAMACSVPQRLLGHDIEVVPTSQKIVALTFDGGASNAGVPRIRRVLANRDAVGTFFLTGAFARTYPIASRRLAAQYPVGNHTYGHLDLTTLGDARVLRQIDRGARAITEVTGQNPRPYFRFPFGARDARTIALVNSRCYVAVRWTVDTLGWMGTSGGQSVDSVVARVHAALRPGAIVLMHVGGHPTDASTLDADALGRVITMVRAHGYRLVTLEAVVPAAP